MSAVTDYAEDLVTRLRDAGITATADIKNLIMPGVLVVPVPARAYDILCGYTASWTVAAIAAGPGDLGDAKVLNDLVDEVREVLPEITDVEAASYAVPGQPEPRPALLCKFTTEVEEP